MIVWVCLSLFESVKVHLGPFGSSKDRLGPVGSSLEMEIVNETLIL